MSSTIYLSMLHMLAMFTAKSFEETPSIGNNNIQLMNDIKHIQNLLHNPDSHHNEQQQQQHHHQFKYEQQLKHNSNNHHRQQQQQQQQKSYRNYYYGPSSNQHMLQQQQHHAPFLPQPQAQYQKKNSLSNIEMHQHEMFNGAAAIENGKNIHIQNYHHQQQQQRSNMAFASAFNFLGATNKNQASNSNYHNKNCGGILTAINGIIQTPQFPNKFETPIECTWIIDASEYFLNGQQQHQQQQQNISIIVYLNQLYILGGLKFTEYIYYSDDFKVPSHRIFELNEDDVTQVTWIQFTSQYLEIKFDMRTLDGTHLRALDRFLDVYGFNITYEIDTNIKSYQCNALKCHFLGNCYAREDFTSYYCDCFPGFGGSDCSKGPLCERHICENGGTCKHIGDASVTCICPKGFKGNQCEIPEIEEITTFCSLNRSSRCHHYCALSDLISAMNNGCKCNSTKNSGNDKVSNRSGKTRFEVTIRLGSNLTALFRAAENLDSRNNKNEHHFPSLLEKHMSRVLRNFNITKVNDLELISNSSKRLDITFHFFGVKSDSQRIREAITRMVERGRLGNITLVSNYHLFDENPPLELQNVIVNQKSPIRENTEFIVSCIAQGSPKIHFQWFKDGVPVNSSKATRDIWTIVLPPEQESVYTSILGISKANRLDEGVYTCKVVDWSVELCRSIHIYIQTPPHLQVEPASVTVYRGESLRVRCLLSPGHNNNRRQQQRYNNIGYSWTRNGGLFQSNPNSEMWEDLYPDGSILKIKNIQKSGEYACIASNSVSPASKSIYVTVIDKGVVELCKIDRQYDIDWPASAPGAVVLAKCPRLFIGYSKRFCEQRDISNSTWLQPDFSNCISEQLLDLFNEFRALTMGYQKTNCSTILKSCLEYAIKRQLVFLPGEAGFLMDLLQEVENYLKIKGTHLEREMAAEIILHILDKVMQNVVSLNSQQQIKKIQLLTQSAALNRETIAASQLAISDSGVNIGGGNSGIVISSGSSSSSSSSVSSSSQSSSGSSSSSSSSSSAMTSFRGSNANGMINSGNSVLTISDSALSLERLNSFRIYTTSVKTLPFNLRIYGDDLFSDQLYLDIRLTKNLMEIMSNGSTIFASVISYKNLTSFLPKTYYSRGSDVGSDYMPASRIITTWLFQSNRSTDNFVEPLSLPLESGRVEIIFQHDSVQKHTDWMTVCGHETRATFESTWRTDLCITKNLMENMTRCICPLSGTFVVLLARRNYNPTITNRTSTRPIFVIISCGCCFLQSCIAFAILIPVLYNRKCCITFLKMQFCTSTSTVMAIFLLGFLKLLPQDWHSIISSTLASLMLLGLSTLVAIPLVIQSELIPKKVQMAAKNNLSTGGGIRGAIGISWLLPILFAISSPLIYSIIGKWPLYWWLQYPSSGFILFIIIQILFVILFILLFITLLSKLLWLIKKHDKHNSSIWKRIGLLYRTAIILFIKLMTDSLFSIYLNLKNNTITSHLFGASCILLGFSILFCFVIKAEYSLLPPTTTNEYLQSGSHLKKTSTKTSLEDNYCSGSINSPLSFYANHEKEKDLDSGPVALTILSTCPLQQQQQPQQQQQQQQVVTAKNSSVETFLGVVAGNPNGNGGTIVRATSAANNSGISKAPPQHHDGWEIKHGICGSSSSPVIPEFYDNYHHQQQQQQNSQNQIMPNKSKIGENHEFVGVETLDILQGVSPDSIIGIRSSGMLKSQSKPITTSTTNQHFQHHSLLQNQHLDDISAIHNVNNPMALAGTTTATTVTTSTQTPKLKKRVTIVEEPKCHQTLTTNHSIIHHPASSSSTATTAAAVMNLPPLITITSSSIDDNEPIGLAGQKHKLNKISENTVNISSSSSSKNISNGNENCSGSDKNSDNQIDGMLDRISHDLDYLLNRTNEISNLKSEQMNDNDIPPPPMPPVTSTLISMSSNLPLPPPPPQLVAAGAAASATTNSCRSVHHEVIIEESEQE